MAYLQIFDGVVSGKRFELTGRRTVIGRSSDCDVPLDVAAVSRRHAVVLQEKGQFFVDDLHSRNGTELGGHRLTQRTPLRHGDRLEICGQTLGFFLYDPTYALEGHPTSDAATLAPDCAEEDPAENAAHVMAKLDLSAGSSRWGGTTNAETKLAALVEISQKLSQTLALEALLPKILDTLFELFRQADRGFVIMRPLPEAPLVAVADKSRRPDQEEKMRISRTVVEEAMTTRQAILSADAATDARFDMAHSISDFQIRSMMCAPMLNSAGEPLGVIQVDTLNPRTPFCQEDLEVLAAVASQAAIAIHNAQLHEYAVAQRAVQRDLDLAAQMQRGLLPATAPQVPGYEFFDYYESARQVGGDYYDYITLADGRFAVVVGDVAGKGVSAALLMARLSSDVRFCLANHRDPAKAVTQANASLIQHNWADRFVTLAVVVIDPTSHQGTLVNAGHLPPLLRRHRGELTPLGEEKADLPLGVLDDLQYQSQTIALQAGDSLLLFTDGLSEAMNADGQLYGLERLATTVQSASGTAQQLGQALLADVRQYVGATPQSDDICLACVGRLAD